MRLLFPLLCLPLLGGCVASVVGDVVTAPVKVASKTADVLTTSQSEADENRGRAMREHEERLGKLSRKAKKAQNKCEDGDRDACERLEDIEQEIAKELKRAYR